MKQKLIKRKNKIARGFTLIELIMAMFISSLIIITVVAAFASAFSAQKKARTTQKNIEDAKGALELMAKIIRMSSNLYLIDANTIHMYNKSLQECIKFQYNTNGASKNKITEYTCAPDSSDANDPNKGPCYYDGTPCSGGSDYVASSGVDITNADLSSAGFYISNYGAALYPIKRVTIRMQMLQDTNANLQTTISLRDYKNLNPTEQ